MPTVAELLDEVALHLGRNREYYPAAEVCRSGLNPALRLLCLLDPTLATERTVVVLPAQSLTLDLRTVAPRAHQVRRVLLGAAGAAVVSRSAAHFAPLAPTTREALARRDPAWLRRTGIPDRWFPLGRHLVAAWPRPVTDHSLTLVCAVVPPPVTADTLTDLSSTPALDSTQHELVARVAAAILLLKDGAGEADRGLQMLMTLFGKEAFTMAAKRLRNLQQQGTQLQPQLVTPAGAA